MKILLKISTTTLISLMILSTPFACSPDTNPISTEQPPYQTSGNPDTPDSSRGHLTTANTIHDVIYHPAFKDFGHFILPLDRGIYDEQIPLNRIASLLPYHNYIDTEQSINYINEMIDLTEAGQINFYNIYTDSRKNQSGLFFFKGRPGAPLAIICPGGGWSYVGSIHEGFPHALELSRKGYNAFVIQYRTGGAQSACEDLAAAITYIFHHASTLEVSTKNYSVWGSSAGARMAAYIGSFTPAAFGKEYVDTRPGTVIMAYTGHSEYTPNDPPTYAIVGENDRIANPATMLHRVEKLQTLGIDTEFHLYPNLRHGFGLGIGTSAEGWLNDAVQFWEKHL